MLQFWFYFNFAALLRSTVWELRDAFIYLKSCSDVICVLVLFLTGHLLAVLIMLALHKQMPLSLCLCMGGFCCWDGHLVKHFKEKRLFLGEGQGQGCVASSSIVIGCLHPPCKWLYSTLHIRYLFGPLTYLCDAVGLFYELEGSPWLLKQEAVWLYPPLLVTARLTRLLYQ